MGVKVLNPDSGNNTQVVEQNPYTDEEWLSKNNTYVDPEGDTTVVPSRVYDGFVQDNPNAKGENYAQGTYFASSDGQAGKSYAVYDGAQNYKGTVTGSGEFIPSGGNEENISALQAAYDQMVLDGVQLDESYTAADYEADVEADRQRARDEYNERQAAAAHERVFGSSSSEGTDHINSIYNAANEASAASLQGAYEQGILSLNNATEKALRGYRDALSQVESQAALNRLQLNELLNANGLNSGSVGQAAMSNNNALQKSLTTLEKSREEVVAALELEKSQLKTQYQTAVAEAVANNKLEEAKALYNEFVRQEEQAQSQQQYANEMLLQSQMNAQVMQSENAALARMQVDAMLAAGQRPSDSLLAQAGYTLEYVNAILAEEQPAGGNNSITSPSQLGATAKNIYNAMISGSVPSANIANALETYYKAGRITLAELDYLTALAAEGLK